MPLDGPTLAGGELRQVDLRGDGWPAPRSNALPWGGPVSAGFDLIHVQAMISLVAGED